MIIDLRSITQDNKHYEFILEKDWWSSGDEGDQVLALGASLHVKADIYKALDKYILDGYLNGRIIVKCDRCLEPFEKEVKSSFRLFLTLPLPEADKTEIELLEEDMEVDFTCGEKIDMDEIIKEQIYLNLTMKCLCSEDCAGLCSMCGGNLNQRKCRCNSETGHPEFAKLKNLKIKGDNL